jgi:hypothetical protein
MGVNMRALLIWGAMTTVLATATTLYFLVLAAHAKEIAPEDSKWLFV